MLATMDVRIPHVSGPPDNQASAPRDGALAFVVGVAGGSRRDDGVYGSLNPASAPAKHPGTRWDEADTADQGREGKGVPPAASAPVRLLDLPPPPPFDLVVDNLSVAVPVAGKVPLLVLLKGAKSGEKTQGTGVDAEERKRWILEDVEANCQSGEVLAILGGSGSGKTTLLNAIAHRMALPIESGKVGYYSAATATPSLSSSSAPAGARELGRREATRRLGFVRQQDFLVACLTVRETLAYAARLRLPAGLDDGAIAAIVAQTIDELGLRDCADTVVGGPLRKGISGGEKRRLSIGCVLVTLPSVLVLDEPTSGLDAFTSYLLLLTLSQLARRGRTIILSIHAPRSDAFPLFDRITLLAKGRVVYSGPRRDCLSWFSELGHDVEPGTNPLDFLVDLSSVDNRTPDAETASRARVARLVDAWRARPADWARLLPTKSTKSLDEHATTPPSLLRTVSPEQAALERAITGRTAADTGAGADNAPEPKRPGFWRQTAVLTARAHKNVYRNVPTVVGFVAQGIILGVIIGLTYYQLPETPTGIQSLKNLSFQLIPGVFYLQQVFWIYKYCTDLVIFDREREDNLYDVIPYVLSDWLSYLIPSVLSPTLYVVLVYFISGMRTDDLAARLFTIIASTVLVQFCVQGVSVMSASVFRSFSGASQVGNALNLFQLMSAGFLLVHVPAYVAWIRWISPYFYSFRIVATLQFQDRVFACPADTGANAEQCVGDNVLTGLDFDLGVNIGVWFAGLVGICVVEYAIACFVLWVYPAGGVKHATEIDSQNRGEGTDVEDSHMARDRIDVDVRDLSLGWERRHVGAVKAADKAILNNISTSFKAGEVSAILGPSGAGKSTLLQLLAGRKLSAGPLARFRQLGQICLAGAPLSPALQAQVAFVEQDDDYHLPSLTVRETLRYAAVLRLPADMARRQKIARTETVLRLLGLKDCADLPVGGPLLKGISGGEKRRLSLAVQMINDPAVLLVDEPTSGLDSSIALSVMQVLRDIAATGRTVIATIHQPRSDIWQLADSVTVLAKGGVVAFTGRRADAVDHFASIGHPMPSDFFNPADHILDLVSVDPRVTTYAASRARVEKITSAWRARTEVGAEMLSMPAPGESVDEKSRWSRTVGKLGGGANGTTGLRTALPVVVERHWKNLWRQKEVCGLFILFYQRLTHGASGAQDRIGITIEATASIAFVGLLNAMAVFPPDRNLYFHEAKTSARYSPATYVICYTVVELGLEVLGACGFAAIMNVGVGMQTSARIYFEYAASIWALLNMGESFAIIFGAWISVEGLTVTVVSTLLSIAGQISGAISLSVPGWLAGIAWATCVKPATRVQLINECRGLTFDCTQAEIDSGACVATSGAEILALFGWHDLGTERFISIAVAIAVAWRIVAWLSVALRVGGLR
ncbi:hypothetical protein Q5752_005823 [Cryptotrichosporon argae]